MVADVVQTPDGNQMWTRLFGYVDAQVNGEWRVYELSEIREITKQRELDVFISRFRRITEEHSPGEWLYSPFFISLRSGKGDIDKLVLQDAKRLLWRFKKGSRWLFNPPDGIDFFGQIGLPGEARPDLPSIFEAAARNLAGTMALQTIDLDAYRPTAMVRADGTRDPATGLYRVHLAHEDIQSWSALTANKIEDPEYRKFRPD